MRSIVAAAPQPHGHLQRSLLSQRKTTASSSNFYLGKSLRAWKWATWQAPPLALLPLAL